MAAQDEKIVGLWVERKQRASQYRRIFEPRWSKNWELYRNTKGTPKMKGQPWQWSESLADGFRIIETMIPQHVLGMFRNNQWFSVEAPTAPGETFQEAAKALLLRGWRKADGYVKSIIALKYAAILGHMVAKLTWEVDVGEREVPDLALEFGPDGQPIAKRTRKTIPDIRHNGPQIHIPDMFSLWQDPTGSEMWWIERIHASLSQLKEANNRFGGELYQNLDQLESKMAFSHAASGVHRSTSHTGAMSIDDVEDLQSLIEGVPESFRRDPDSVDLWQCWGWVPPTRAIAENGAEESVTYDDTQWRLQVIANGDTLIRDVPAPTPDHRPPYINVPAIPIPHQIYGDGVLSMIGPLIDQRSFLENRRLDEVALNIHGQFLIDERADVTGQDLFKMPGGALRINPNNVNGTLRDIFVPLPRQPVMQEAYMESAQKERQMMDLSGATEPFQGKAFGGRTTATEASLVSQTGQGRFQLATMWFDEMYKKQILMRMFKMYQSRMTDEEFVQLEQNHDISGNLDFSDLQYDIDIYVDSGLFGSMDPIALQNLERLTLAFSQIPEAQMRIKWDQLATDAIYRLGFNRPAKYRRTDDEVAAIQKQQEEQRQQEQLLQLALSGANQQSQ